MRAAGLAVPGLARGPGAEARPAVVSVPAGNHGLTTVTSKPSAAHTKLFVKRHLSQRRLEQNVRGRAGATGSGESQGCNMLVKMPRMCHVTPDANPHETSCVLVTVYRQDENQKGRLEQM